MEAQKVIKNKESLINKLDAIIAGSGDALPSSGDLKYLRQDDVKVPTFYIGAGTCGLGAGADKTIAAIKKYMSDRNLSSDVVEVGCVGLCSSEPLVDIQLPGKSRMSFEQIFHNKVDALLDDVLNGSLPATGILGQYTGNGVREWENAPMLRDHDFFRQQQRIVLRDCGRIDPSSLQQYIGRGGYSNFLGTIAEYHAADVRKMVIDSGLRGRGGGGFLTGKKWEFAAGTKADRRYLICNADEGDPGAFMDRAVIEGDPHRLIEGMAIAAYAIGATKAYVYIRAEYPLAIARLKKALEDAKTAGLLGRNIFETGTDLDIIIKMGAGAFVCGEETALIHSIEGKRGMPRPRPPYPATSGLFGKPTIINNVETLANLPTIMENGPEWYANIGTASSKGTKVFALSGKVERTGLVEIPMGTSIRSIIDIAGGVKDGKKIKSVQIGGPSGGCVTEENLDIPVDYESLSSIGAMMGSGGLVVMDEETCMVDVAKFFLDFVRRESCGKCIPCREGTRRMLEIMEQITHKPVNGTPYEPLERMKGVLQLEKLANVIKQTSLCGLGQTAPNPVLSTLKYFREEYESHVFDRKCPAGVCTELRTFSIDVEKCTGCMACKKKCPTAAIIGSRKEPHFIVEDKCIGCGSCAEVCKFDAVNVLA